MEAASLSLMRDLGFPLWALVVAYGTWRISTLFQASSVELSNRFTTLMTKIGDNHVDTEKRLILLEKTVERLDKIVERHEADMRQMK